jgi:hypothetical protein
MNRSTLFWGIVLILAGGLFLLSNLDIIDVNAWQLIGPLLLILIGVWVLFGALSRGGSRKSQTVAIPLDGAVAARVRINHGAGRLVVDGSAEPGELITGEFSGGLEHRSRTEGDSLTVDLRIPERSFPFVFFWDDAFNWKIGLNQQAHLYLDIKTGANEAQIDLQDLQIRDLKLSTGASSTRITMPARAGYTHAKIDSGVASVKVAVPVEVAARIKVDSGLSGIEVDTRRFIRSGSLYESPGYESAENRLELEIHTGVGSVSIG